MDSIEVSRKRAEELHKAAVSLGHNPLDPYAFACEEAKTRGIEVQCIPKNDVRLHGGRALYDPEAQLILHEESGDVFTNAFYVAHEIGHVEFGGAEEFTSTSEIDPLRTSEAPSVGVDRVVDYNHKQRREVQMDLFAREFLLPRPWLKQLHLDGATASSIAGLCKAPFPVVAQQLLDALLLPSVELPTPKERKPKPLNDAQRKAVEHRGRAFLLEAGPGTGKTQTLVARVNALLAEGVSPGKILILTFSNKAAAELSERITEQNPQATSGMWIGTFHAFGLDLVRRFHDRLGLPVEPRLLDRGDAIDVLEDEYPRLELRHFKNLWDPSEPLGFVLNAISRANDEVVDAAKYAELAEAMLKAASDPDQVELAERCVETATVFSAYEQIKLTKGCVDFGDLVSLPVKLCETHPDVCEHLAQLYEHVLVDEFQDVNRSSVRLLTAITRDGQNLWAVGDAKQSIYRFRGASSYNMVRFGREDFPGGKRGRLVLNYRSVPEVRDAFIQFASTMKVTSGGEISLDVDRPAAGFKPEFRSVKSDDDEIAAVAENIEALQRAGLRYSKQAVLCSGNDRLSRVAQGLEQLGIPVLYLGSLFERPEIKDLLCLLGVIVDRRAMGLVRIAAMENLSVSLADVARVLSHLKQNDLEPLGWAGALGSVSDLSAEGLQTLRRIGEIVGGFEVHADPWTVIASVLFDRTRMAAEVAAATDVRARSRGIAIWQFANFLRTQPPGNRLPIVRLLSRIRRLVLHADERDLRQLPLAAQSIDAVRLFTMHGSKGLEFEAVHIPGLTAASLPRSPGQSLARAVFPPDGMIEGATGAAADSVREGVVEEQECLFFVAISRARDRLFLYAPTTMANNRPRARSPFIDRLENTVLMQNVVPSTALPEIADTLISVTFQGGFRFSDHKLALYERCPRRFFYAHILEVGGRRTENAFMQLHNAVQQVVSDITQGTVENPSLAELEEKLEAAWTVHGPVDHGYRDEYKRIASQLLRFFLDSTSSLRPMPAPELRLPVSGGEIIVTPDQVLTDDNGRVQMRRIRTGHKRSKEEDNLAAAAFHIAATAHSPGCTVALVYLSDGDVIPVKMTDRVLGNRSESIGKTIGAIKAGQFPLKTGFTCPRCPAFFICGSVPAGPLQKIFAE